MLYSHVGYHGSVTKRTTNIVNIIGNDNTINKRKTIVVGGFNGKAERPDVEQFLKEVVVKDFEGAKVAVYGRLPNVGKLHFPSSDDMWDFLTANKGQKFEFKGNRLWHNINKTNDEQDLSKRTSKALRSLRQHLCEKVGKSEEIARSMVQGDSDRGLVYYRPEGGDVPIKLFDRKGKSFDLKVHEDANTSALDFDFHGKVAEIYNLD